MNALYTDVHTFEYFRYSGHIKELLSLLSNRLAGPNSEPLSQLLLRLDFNHWFSSSSEL